MTFYKILWKTTPKFVENFRSPVENPNDTVENGSGKLTGKQAEI